MCIGEWIESACVQAVQGQQFAPHAGRKGFWARVTESSYSADTGAKAQGTKQTKQ